MARTKQTAKKDGSGKTTQPKVLLKQRKQQERQRPPLEESRSHIGTDLALWPLREIRRYQKSTKLLIRKLPFQRLVREIALDFWPRDGGPRFYSDCYKGITGSCRGLLSRSSLKDTNLCAIHAKRVTIMPKGHPIGTKNPRGKRHKKGHYPPFKT